MIHLLRRLLLGLSMLFAFVAPGHAKEKPAQTKAVKKGGKAKAVKGRKVTRGKASESKAKVAEAPSSRRRITKGTMTLRNINTRDRLDSLRVVEFSKKGKREVAKLVPRGKKKLGWMLRDFRNGHVRQPPDRLLWQLYQVQQHFDAPVEIVSGYRHWARKTSRHFKGWAVDFRVDGVDPRTVWSFCKSFKDVGCGHYPTSGFVHMDIRDKSYSWVDVSGPGEPARYVDGKRPAGGAKETAPAAAAEE